MKAEELKAVAIRAKEVGIAIYGADGDKDFDNVQIDEDGNLSVHFSHYCYGDTSYETIYLTERDMTDPIEETLAKYKKKAQDEADRKAKEKLENERKQKLAQEKAERTLYEKLKAKFEGTKN